MQQGTIYNSLNSKCTKPNTVFAKDLFICRVFRVANAVVAPHPIPNSTLCATERSLFMAGAGTEEKELCSLKKNLPHHLLKSNFPYPTEGKQ